MVVESPSNLRMIVGFESMLKEFSSERGCHFDVIVWLLFQWGIIFHAHLPQASLCVAFLFKSVRQSQPIQAFARLSYQE